MRKMEIKTTYDLQFLVEKRGGGKPMRKYLKLPYLTKTQLKDLR